MELLHRSFESTLPREFRLIIDEAAEHLKHNPRGSRAILVVSLELGLALDFQLLVLLDDDGGGDDLHLCQKLPFKSRGSAWQE